MRIRSRSILLAGTIALVAASLCTGTASAYDGVWLTPGWNNTDQPDVISDCEGGHGGATPNSCTFHETSSWNQYGAVHRSSDVYNDCGGSAPLTQAISWSYTTASSSTRGSSTTVSGNGTLKTAIRVGVSASRTTDKNWTYGNTVTSSSTTTAIIPPHRQGAFFWQPAIHISAGWMEIDYPKRNHGHYIWYYDGKNTGNYQQHMPVQLSNGQMDGKLSWSDWAC
jgi:hypothetical protein